MNKQELHTSIQHAASLINMDPRCTNLFLDDGVCYPILRAFKRHRRFAANRYFKTYFYPDTFTALYGNIYWLGPTTPENQINRATALLLFEQICLSDGSYKEW